MPNRFAALQPVPLNPLQRQITSLLSSLLGPSTTLTIPTPAADLCFPGCHCRRSLLQPPSLISPQRHRDRARRVGRRSAEAVGGAGSVGEAMGKKLVSCGAAADLEQMGHRGHTSLLLVQHRILDDV
jgi:hypothetical protein